MPDKNPNSSCCDAVAERFYISHWDCEWGERESKRYYFYVCSECRKPINVKLNKEE